MERPEEVDQDFNFDAPAYYDLLNPSAETEYVNNADGYFNSSLDQTNAAVEVSMSTKKVAPPSRETTLPIIPSFPNQMEARMSELTSHLTIVDNKENTQTQGNNQKEHEHQDGGFQMPQDEEEVHFSHDNDNDNDPNHNHNLCARVSKPKPAISELERQHKSKHGLARTSKMGNLMKKNTQSNLKVKHVPSVRTKLSLFQPTQSSMAKRDAILAQREARCQMKSMISKKPMIKKPLTKPTSPNIRIAQRISSRSSDDMMKKKSSTSLELERVRDEMNQLKRVKDEHEHYYRTHEHAVVPSKKTTLYSKKPLTIPASPQFETDKQRVHAHVYPETNVEDHYPKGFVKPEELFSREYPAMSVRSGGAGPSVLTTSQSPKLATSLRAKLRRPVVPEEAEPTKRCTTKYHSSGLTLAKTPQLATSARAKVAQYKPVIRIDEDEVELSKPFRARPVNRNLFARPVKSTTTSHPNVTTVPQSPQLSTASRIRRPMVHTHVLKPNKVLLRNNKLQKAHPKTLTQPQSPALRSTERHLRYREDLERKIKQEQALASRQRQFKAKPMLVVSDPPIIQASTKPLTEVEPFVMPGTVFQSRAEMKKSQARQDDLDAKIKLAQVKARACPDMSQDQVFVPQPCTKRLTEFSAFELASEVQAQKRQAFEHADALRRQAEAEAETARVAQLEIFEQQELRRLRETELTFQSTPRQGLVAFQPRPSTQHLTVPESPLLQTKHRSVTEHLKKD